MNLKGVKPDDEIRFNSGTYFVFIVPDRLELVPEDTNEILDSMWVSLSRIRSLTTNKDLTSFYKNVNIDSLIKKVENRKIIAEAAEIL